MSTQQRNFWIAVFCGGLILSIGLGAPPELRHLPEADRPGAAGRPRAVVLRQRAGHAADGRVLTLRRRPGRPFRHRQGRRHRRGGERRRPVRDLHRHRRRGADRRQYPLGHRHRRRQLPHHPGGGRPHGAGRQALAGAGHRHRLRLHRPVRHRALRLDPAGPLRRLALHALRADPDLAGDDPARLGVARAQGGAGRRWRAHASSRRARRSAKPSACAPSGC